MKKVFLLVFICGLIQHQLKAQVQGTGRGNGADSTRPVNFSAEKLTNTKLDSVKEVSIAVGKVFFTDRSTKFYCDSAIYRKPEEVVEAFGHVHIVDKDTVNAYGDYMIYYKLDKTAILKKNVTMTDGKVVLTTDEFEYNTQYKTGIYRNGGKIVNGKTILTSKDAIYYSDIKDAYFKNDVKLRDPQYDVDTDSLLYNTQSQIATFITKTAIKIKDSSGVKNILTSEGYYDLKNKQAHLGKRPIIKDGTTEITGDTVYFDDATGENYARGRAVYKDTAQGLAILANKLQGNKFSNRMLATEQPLMILKQGNDSTYISADTLFAGLLSDLYAQQEAMAKRDSIANAIATAKADSLAAKRLAAQHRAAALRDSLAAKDSLSNIAQGTKDSLSKKNNMAIRDSLGQKNHIPIHDSLTSKDSLTTRSLFTKGDSLHKKEMVAIGDSLIIQSGKRDSLNKRNNIVAHDSLASKDSLISRSLANKEDSIDKKELLVKGDSLAIKDTSFRRDLVLKNAPPGKRDTLMIGNKQMKTVDADKATKDTTGYKRYILAYHNVRIFTDSSQAVCDSLFYSGADSVFRLITNPVVWASKSQITGDTIYLYTANKKPSRFYVFENGIVINRLDDGYYNQLQGHTINGYFKDGNIDYVRSKGSAESIYYAQDEDKAYVGVNRSTADIIDIRFVNKEVNKVVFISDVSGTMYPFKQVSQGDMRLKNFRWLEAYRPKSKFELFEPAAKTIKQDLIDKENEKAKDDEDKPAVKNDSTLKKMPAKTESIDKPALKTDSLNKQQEVKPGSTEKPIIKADSAIIKTDSSSIKSANPIMKPDSTIIKKDSTNIKTAGTLKKPE